MIINLDTGSASTAELTALIALCASLGGRLPVMQGYPVDVSVDLTTIKQQLSGRVDRPVQPLSTSEQLLQDEAARVAGSVEPDDEQTDGDGTDPASLDVEGIPWDARIHSTPGKINADGTWRKRRGVSEVDYGRIYAELQAGNDGTGTPSSSAAPEAGGTVAAPIAPPPPVTEQPPAPPAPVAPAVAEVEQAPLAPPAPAAPAAPAVTASGEAVAANASNSRFDGFPAFVQAVNAVRAGGIPYLELNGFAANLGVTGGFKDMKDHPELWETFYALTGGQ